MRLPLTLPKPWPRTLLWRSFLLIAMLMGLSLLAWFQIYKQISIRSRTEQTAQMLASAVNLTRSALLAADATRRGLLLVQLMSQEGLRVYPAEPTDLVVEAEDTGFMQDLHEALQRRIGPSTRIASSVEGEEGFFVSFVLDDAVPEDEYWLMLPAERIRAGTLAGWIGWALIVLLLSLLGAWLLMFSVSRPLKSLEHAARMVGQGELPPALPERGPRELRAVAEAFNQMSHDLAQLESDRALILAGVSHDLRTPLARLRLGLELSGVPDTELEAMSTDIDDMDRIIGQFLDFARDTQAVELLETDLAGMLGELAERYRKRGANIVLEAEALPPLKLRADALRRAIANLIDNALRYGGKEQTIDVSLRRDKTQLIIEVADQGPGIPESQFERLKRPFTRLEQARSNTDGSGLGLAIVDRITRQHGGQFELANREGGGLSARIVLPATPPSGGSAQGVPGPVTSA
ncbi:ATP-binding protein [Viridibacterium curvum]|uniref:histidine kinase n=1 Tax=Viridibacterium curvum TaxID=1101404 RepID=A0ABP9QCA8_9RHOO